MADGKTGKVGPVSKKIIECVKANPGIHAAQIARVLGVNQGMRATVRALISSGYLSRGKAKVALDPQYRTATPLEYTGKPFEGYNEGGISKRSHQIQERIAAQIEREKRLAESAAWAGKAIRAMVDAGRAAA
ncbi:winged helix-turn-helix domain-containing protein [Burkholderia metallica]|uniref:Winged helix-turn-helix domain-containing protein n=1 Tax=Burkholderia metallica TaxID=488729 RepID=A0ABT8PET5_9BURK|nr:winged helix-turn-helix domain-containing protein [Burkholderia metallica]MDN7933640.1 winged helix-turn-helix domain-containing protein [Burkholderia metallica]